MDTKIIKMKLLPGGKPPVRSSEGAAGWELFCREVDVDYIEGILTCYTGVCLEIPRGYYGDARARSSIANTKLSLTNGAGVIDSDFRGEI